jgi:hypothetical protein
VHVGGFKDSVKLPELPLESPKRVAEDDESDAMESEEDEQPFDRKEVKKKRKHEHGHF